MISATALAFLRSYLSESLQSDIENDGYQDVTCKEKAFYNSIDDAVNRLSQLELQYRQCPLDNAVFAEKPIPKFILWLISYRGRWFLYAITQHIALTIQIRELFGLTSENLKDLHHELSLLANDSLQHDIEVITGESVMIRLPNLLLSISPITRLKGALSDEEINSSPTLDFAVSMTQWLSLSTTGQPSEVTVITAESRELN